MFYAFYLSKHNPHLQKGPHSERTFDQFQKTEQTKASTKISNRLHTDQSIEHSKPVSIAKSKQFLKQMVLIENIKNTYKIEIEKIVDENRIRQTQPNQQIMQMMKLNREVLTDIVNKLNKMLQVKQKRNVCIDIMQDIGHSILTIRNINLKILINLSFAKMAQSYKLINFCILLSKYAKRLSDSEQFLKFKMKAYQMLSFCFLALRSQLAKLYITKYLMCSWKLSQKNHELRAYELLGKYYFYEGSLELAKQFHTRMVEGDLLPDKSSLRRLGISKLEQGSIGRSRKDQFSCSEEAQFTVSSDEEPFEIIFNKNDDQPYQQAKFDLEQEKNSRKRKTLINFNLRKLPQFAGNNLQKTKQEYFNANLNIRASHHNKLSSTSGQLDLQKLKGLSRAGISMGDMKDPIFMNHLSPNRCLVNYQYLELNKSLSAHKTVANIEPLHNIRDMNTINAELTKLLYILNVVINWLDEKMGQY